MPRAEVEEATWQAIPAPNPGGLSGFFEHDELTEYLRMLAHNERAGLFTIHSQQLSGHLALQRGRVRDAITNDGARGRGAATRLMILPSGQFEFIPDLPESFKPTVDLDMESLLLDAARKKDESGRWPGRGR